MKIAAFVLAVVGAVIGVLTGLVEHGAWFGKSLAGTPASPQIGLSYVTFAMSAVGLLGGFTLLAKPRLGAALCLLATVGGVLGAYVLWEAAGSFLFVSALLAFAWSGQDGKQVKRS